MKFVFYEAFCSVFWGPGHGPSLAPGPSGPGPTGAGAIGAGAKNG